MMSLDSTKKTGFTVVELIIVMSIITLILVAAAVGIQYSVQLSRDQNAQKNLVNLSQLVRDYYTIHGAYPFVPCSGTSAGFDKTGSLNDLDTALTAGSLSPADMTELNAVVTSATTAGNVSSYGYCSGSSNGSGGSGAYILVLATKSAQTCQDSTGSDFYALGDGYYNNGGFKNYYDIPSDYASALIGKNYGTACYK